MILAIDIGNSSISCGVYCEPDYTTAEARIPECFCRFKIASKHLSADEYLLLFHQFLSFYKIAPEDSFHENARTDTGSSQGLNACVIASVVPALTETISKVARTITGTNPLVIGRGVRTGFGIKIQNPEQLGADIVANAAGAFMLAEPPFVILDVGTATTITFVNEHGEIPGTIIMPGLTVSMEALTDSAALLSDVPLDIPQELLGKNTSESIRSGVIGGHVLMIDGFIRNIREQYTVKDAERKLGLVATGGLAETILPFCRNKFRYEADLTLLGEISLYMKNRPIKIDRNTNDTNHPKW